MSKAEKIEIPATLEPILEAMGPGKTLTLMRDGKPVAELRQLKQARQPRNTRKALEELRQLRAALPPAGAADQAEIDEWRHGSDR